MKLSKKDKKMKNVTYLTLVTIMLLFSGCVGTDSEGLLQIKKKNKAMFDLFDFKVNLIVDKNNPNYKEFKKIWDNGNIFIPSSQAKECYEIVGYQCEAMVSDNALEKQRQCIGNFGGATHTNSFSTISAIANNTRKRIVEKSCRYSKNINPKVDYISCVKKHYTPAKVTSKQTLSGTTMRLHEDNLYGIIKTNLHSRGRALSGTNPMVDKFTWQKFLLVEYDDYAEVAVKSKLHWTIKDSKGYRMDYSTNQRAINTLIQILDNYGIKYTFKRY